MRWFAILLSVASCSQSGAPAAEKEQQQMLSKAEATRGAQACRAYVDRLCHCAKANAQFAEQCTIAKDIPETLRLATEASYSQAISEKDRWKIIYNTRDQIKTCIEKENQLDPTECPRLQKKN